MTITRMNDHGSRESERGSISVIVAAALNRLSPTQREVVHLRYIVGLSTSETAEVVGRSEDATRAVLSRGLQQLREMMTSVP